MSMKSNKSFKVNNKGVDDDINIVSKVIELVSPFITDYAYDINDIKLPKKLLYEGKLLLLILLLLLTTHYVRLWMF